MVNFKEIYRFSRLQMGSNFFQGVQLFPGGVQLLIPYRNPFNLWFSRGGPDPLPPPLWIRTWCSHHSFMVEATIHYLIWAWQTLIDRRMYHPFIVIYLIISVYYRNLRCFNRWQLYILFNNVSYFGWSLTNHWPRALFPIKHDCRGLNCHFNLLTDILCELRYRRLLIDWFDSLRPINNLSVIKGRVFLGWTSTKLGLMFLLKDTTQWRQWGSNPRPFGLGSSTLPLSHCDPYTVAYALLRNDQNIQLS